VIEMAGVVLYPDVNGVRHSYASIELTFGPHILIGHKSIEYSRTRERGYVYGASPDPLGKTRGKNTYKGAIELFLAEYALVTSLPGYGDIPFPVVVTYSTNGLDVITDILLGCTLDSNEANHTEGTDGLTRKVELNPVKILFNGVDDMLIPLVGFAA
jgi:hypothetical protein